MKKSLAVCLLLCFTLLFSCSEDETNAPTMRLLSSTINGTRIQETMSNIAVEAEITLTFDAALNPAAFKQALAITAPTAAVSYQVSYRNQSSQVVISPALAFNTAYSFTLNNQAIGTEGQRLAESFEFQFTTTENEIITSQAPCGSASPDCLAVLSLEGSNEEFQFYSNYPIYNESASWQELTSAIILVHGANRNSDDYFNWMTATLENTLLDNNTVLIAPSFKLESETGENEAYWGSNNWREGQNAQSESGVSSFAVVDALIAQLSNKERFPVLEEIVITGHSSGGLFTHSYAAANTVDTNPNGIAMRYIVANSQYFYYPTPERLNESTNTRFTPTSCPVYQQWPLGANALPPYLANTPVETLNEQFVNRSILYLLGNGNQADPSLNTSDCDANLLGSTRYRRGENMFQFMELTYGEAHNHERYIVNGIGHDGQRMYQSTEFEELITVLLGD